MPSPTGRNVPKAEVQIKSELLQIKYAYHLQFGLT
jgi:hypothetical protein